MAEWIEMGTGRLLNLFLIVMDDRMGLLLEYFPSPFEKVRERVPQRLAL